MTEPKKKRTRKKEYRPPTARFNTDECKVLLECVKFSREKDHFWSESHEYRKSVYKIEDKLKFRISQESNKSENREGNSGRVIHPEDLHGDNRPSPGELQIGVD